MSDAQTIEGTESAPAAGAFEPTPFFEPSQKPPESFEDSKARLAALEEADFNRRKAIADREAELCSGGVKCWHEGRFIPADQVPPPPPPPPGPAIGDKFAAIRSSKIESARERYFQIMRDRAEDAAAELEEVAGILGFSVERVLLDLKTIARATDLVRDCLSLEKSDVGGKADDADRELRKFKAETQLILDQRNATEEQLQKTASEAHHLSRRHYDQCDLVRKLGEENPELLRGIWIREIDAAGMYPNRSMPTSAE